MLLPQQQLAHAWSPSCPQSPPDHCDRMESSPSPQVSGSWFPHPPPGGSLPPTLGEVSGRTGQPGGPTQQDWGEGEATGVTVSSWKWALCRAGRAQSWTRASRRKWRGETLGLSLRTPGSRASGAACKSLDGFSRGVSFLTLIIDTIVSSLPKLLGRAAEMVDGWVGW